MPLESGSQDWVPFFGQAINNVVNKFLICSTAGPGVSLKCGLLVEITHDRMITQGKERKIVDEISQSKEPISEWTYLKEGVDSSRTRVRTP